MTSKSGTAVAEQLPALGKTSYWTRLRKDLHKNHQVYLMIIPVILYYLIFCYKPMYGALIAFQDYNPLNANILDNKWVGFANFLEFFQGRYFWRLIKNTLTISLASTIVGFPIPIIFALLINEIKNKKFTKIVQTMSYMPHFISIVIVCSMIISFTNANGFLNTLFTHLGYSGKPMLSNPDLFVPIYVISGIWQGLGWDSILYIAALSGIDQELYEAASIDGASRWQQMLHITLPGIAPTIVTMFILRMGGLMNVGYEKVILLYSPITYSSADVISSYVYRMGIERMNYSFSTAVGLFNSAINIFLLFITNRFSKKISDTSLF
ncbi:MAG: ABC transporter permease subunit [Gemmiger sp.]|nr:ABC transporter permease subunit [Gemmiger sp.]